jgi:hypothetical protein
MLYRFDSAESLGAWEASDQRVGESLRERRTHDLRRAAPADAPARLVAAGTTRPLASLKLSGTDDLMVQ